jgi:uncharacterized membrane protein YecN with MAPEG domain
MTVLPIALTIAAAAVLLNIWLGMRVMRVRMAHKVLMGDGGVPLLTARMRAQASFIEYAPLFVILLALVELAHGSATWLWLGAILFILGRVAHAFGMDRPAPNPLRAGGMAASMLPMLALAGYALAMPYLTVPAGAPTTTVVDR